MLNVEDDCPNRWKKKDALVFTKPAWQSLSPEGAHFTQSRTWWTRASGRASAARARVDPPRWVAHNFFPTRRPACQGLRGALLPPVVKVAPLRRRYCWPHSTRLNNFVAQAQARNLWHLVLSALGRGSAARQKKDGCCPEVAVRCVGGACGGGAGERFVACPS